MLAKKELGYMLMAKDNRFWSLLILLLSVASIKRKLLKTTYTEECRESIVHTNSESCNNYSDRKKSIQFQTNYSDITAYSHRSFFDAFVDS